MARANASYPSELLEALGRGWNRFWFTPEDPLPCCVLRMGTGLLAVAHFASLGIDLERWYGKGGLLSSTAVATLLAASGEDASYRFSYLSQFAGAGELWGVHACAIVAAILFTLGLSTRISGVFTLIGVLAYVHRIPLVAGHLEPVLVFLLAYLILAPSGARLSLDALLRRRQRLPGSSPQSVAEVEPSVAANIGLRLIQVHTAMFCAMMGLTKLYGDAWWEGNAIWLLMAQTESRPFDLTSIRNAGQFGEYLVNFWTLGILYFELAFPVLVWNRLLRPFLVLIGVIVWALIILVTGQLLFGLAMVIASAAFLPAEFFELIPGRGSLSMDPAAAMAR